MYKVVEDFFDLQHYNYKYMVGDSYPIDSCRPTDDRIRQLIVLGVIVEIGTGEGSNEITVSEKLTVKELKQIAKEKGLSGYSKMNEAQLIELIGSVKHDTEQS